MGKQRISKELVKRRYYELLSGGTSRMKAAKIIGMLVLNFYEIDFTVKEIPETEELKKGLNKKGA